MKQTLSSFVEKSDKKERTGKMSKLNEKKKARVEPVDLKKKHSLSNQLQRKKLFSSTSSSCSSSSSTSASFGYDIPKDFLCATSHFSSSCPVPFRTSKGAVKIIGIDLDETLVSLLGIYPALQYIEFLIDHHIELKDREKTFFGFIRILLKTCELVRPEMVVFLSLYQSLKEMGYLNYLVVLTQQPYYRTRDKNQDKQLFYGNTLANLIIRAIELEYFHGQRLFDLVIHASSHPVENHQQPNKKDLSKVFKHHRTKYPTDYKNDTTWPRIFVLDDKNLDTTYTSTDANTTEPEFVQVFPYTHSLSKHKILFVMRNFIDQMNVNKDQEWKKSKLDEFASRCLPTMMKQIQMGKTAIGKVLDKRDTPMSKHCFRDEVKQRRLLVSYLLHSLCLSSEHPLSRKYMSSNLSAPHSPTRTLKRRSTPK